ncbi:MAG TPA: SIS domain-containing protein [Actinophytocola sp.]|nr:SIS domain-containing protein [Actinophytocola sp.]
MHCPQCWTSRCPAPRRCSPTAGAAGFFSGQGRSGLVAHMAAMRLMHVGFNAHAVGEATAPSIAGGDDLVVISGSGETGVTLHSAQLALGLGAHILAVTTRADSTLAQLAEAVTTRSTPR